MSKTQKANTSTNHAAPTVGTRMLTNTNLLMIRRMESTNQEPEPELYYLQLLHASLEALKDDKIHLTLQGSQLIFIIQQLSLAKNHPFNKRMAETGVTELVEELIENLLVPVRPNLPQNLLDLLCGELPKLHGWASFVDLSDWRKEVIHYTLIREGILLKLLTQFSGLSRDFFKGKVLEELRGQTATGRQIFQTMEQLDEYEAFDGPNKAAREKNYSNT